MNTVTLLGSEAVEHAGWNMKSAAEDMNRAAGNFEEVVRQQRLANDMFLTELRLILEEHAKKICK